jgi:hypothetical protein
MKRREPPPIAAWMLEHLTPVGRDEALAGDLHEVFRTGKSNNWYRRQVLAACTVSWYEGIRARAPLLMFALLWSMVSPAWNSLCVRLEGGNPIPDRLLSVFGPIWLLPALVLWTILHSIFLWAGILSCSVLHSVAKSPINRAKIKRGFLLASLVFIPLYGAMFVLVTLNWYGHFESWQLVNSPFGQIADVRLLADAIRLPYLVALVVALWGVVPGSIRDAQVVDGVPLGSSEPSESLAPVAPADVFTAKRFLVFVVIAGLINAMIAAFMLCRLPDLHEPDLGALFGRALMFVVVGALAGVGGSWLYWENPASPFRENPPLPFSLHALACSAGWLWVPAMILFQEQLSAAGAFVAMVGAVLLASSLRRVTRPVFGAAQGHAPISGFANEELFAESLYRPPIEVHGYAVAIGLYLAGAALATRSYYTGAALLSGSAFLFAWMRGISTSDSLDRRHQYKRAILRVLLAAVPALLVTVWALLDGVAYRNRMAPSSVGAAASAGTSVEKSGTLQTKGEGKLVGGGGYVSLILWPYPGKEKVVPPIVMHDALLAPGTKRPVIIHFNGVYWFLQPPNKVPGATAHQANGTPLSVGIKSINSVPLVMDAHQFLSAPIRTGLCREIAVEIENRDNRMGLISLGVLLTDGTAAKKQTIYLGEQQILSTQPEHFSFKTEPIFETLRFSIPADAKIRKFDEITVMVLPDIEHAFEAPKIAVQQFQLFPR